jgi:hypothetical protein
LETVIMHVSSTLPCTLPMRSIVRSSMRFMATLVKADNPLVG